MSELNSDLCELNKAPLFWASGLDSTSLQMSSGTDKYKALPKMLDNFFSSFQKVPDSFNDTSSLQESDYMINGVFLPCVGWTCSILIF